jgi:hypothetical protein
MGWPGVLLATLATCAAAKKPQPAPAPDASLAEEEQLACAPDVPEGFQVHTGYAVAADQAEAIDQARLEARRLALESLCAGKSEARCAVLRRHVESWKVPFYNAATGRACAHVGVNRQWIDDDTRDQAKLFDELRGLAARVEQAVGADPLRIEPPVWATTGCTAGDVGAALVAELRNGFGAVGGVRLVEGESARATRLQLALASAKTDVLLTAALRATGDDTRTPIEGLRFPADLFGAAPSDACRFDRDLGLQGGRRVGGDGRIVSVDVPARGSFCEGDALEPTVTVSGRSEVVVFSVARSGEAYRVWPPPGSDGIVDGTVSLGALTLHPTPGRGDEKLLAVAVAPGADWGAMRGWSGFCRVPALTADLYPAGAAAGAATFQVLPFDADACLVRNVRQLPAPEIPPSPVCAPAVGR